MLFYGEKKFKFGLFSNINEIAYYMHSFDIPGQRLKPEDIHYILYNTFNFKILKVNGRNNS